MKNKEIAITEEKRTSMNIALSYEDKKFLKIYAIEHGTTVATIIHEYIANMRKVGEKNA